MVVACPQCNHFRGAATERLAALCSQQKNVNSLSMIRLALLLATSEQKTVLPHFSWATCTCTHTWPCSLPCTHTHTHTHTFSPVPSTWHVCVNAAGLESMHSPPEPSPLRAALHHVRMHMYLSQLGTQLFAILKLSSVNLICHCN